MLCKLYPHASVLDISNAEGSAPSFICNSSNSISSAMCERTTYLTSLDFTMLLGIFNQTRFRPFTLLKQNPQSSVKAFQWRGSRVSWKAVREASIPSQWTHHSFMGHSSCTGLWPALSRKYSRPPWTLSWP